MDIVSAETLHSPTALIDLLVRALLPISEFSFLTRFREERWHQPTKSLRFADVQNGHWAGEE